MTEGQIMYQGSASKALPYFSKIGFQIPTYSNPVDHFIKALSVSYPKTETDKAKLDHLALNYTHKIHNKLKQSIIPQLEEAESVFPIIWQDNLSTSLLSQMR